MKVVRFCKGVWRYVKGKVGLIRFVGKVGEVSLQIKCLQELNCVCVLFLLALHVRSSLLGPGGGRYQIRIPSRGCYEKYLMLTVVGVEPKERESPVGLFFIMDATWPQGAAADRWNRITSSLPKFLHICYIYSSFIFFSSRLSHATRANSEVGTSSRFQKFFSSDVNSSGRWEVDPRSVKTHCLNAI